MTGRCCSLRIAILAHSTNPRGGVVHALELADALTRLGHEAAVHAPDPTGRGFFRPTACAAVCVPASPAGRSLTTLVKTRAAEYVRWFEKSYHRDFDVFHAQDGISANALATLKQNGLIPCFARTVHHVDTFLDPRLAALQQHAITSADRLLVVSRLWRDALARCCGRRAVVVGNGVDIARFSPRPEPHDDVLRARLELGEGPVFIAVGGIEERKNSHRLLQAFLAICHARPHARLLIVGGASLLDHAAYQARFAELMNASDVSSDAVIQTGPVPDADMPSLYRIADVLVAPSLKEGFGLVVLEAMASGLPVVASRMAPFTEYVDEDAAFWCDPLDVGSIGAAMRRALEARLRCSRIARGYEVVHRHDWISVARSHLGIYGSLAEQAHA
jgi:glycosyltransferase-like protein